MVMRARLITGLLLLAAAGCHDSAKAPTAPGATGVYTLVTVDGKALPAATTNVAGFPARTYFGRLTLADDGTYIREQRDSTPQPTGSVANGPAFDYGTWTRRGDSVFLASTLTVAHYPPGKGTATPTAATIVFGAATYGYTTP